MSELRQIAALYIDPRGPYPKMAGVDCWDEKRDARLYAGPATNGIGEQDPEDARICTLEFRCELHRPPSDACQN